MPESDTSPLPDWLGARQVDDRRFAQAYARLPDSCRAWIKTLAAGVHALSGPPGLALSREHLGFDSGFSCGRDARPVAAAVLFLDQAATSPAQAAAAALPAILSGAPRVWAVRLGPGAGRADLVLGALEVCGLETVLLLDRARSLRLLAHLAQEPGQAAALFLGSGPLLASLASRAALLSGLALWRQAPVDRLGVFAPDALPDLEALALMHPGAGIELWAPGRARRGLPATVARRTGDFPAFLASGLGVALVPGELAEAARQHIPLVLTPGAEGCFAWPGLGPDLFLRRSLSLGRGL